MEFIFIRTFVEISFLNHVRAVPQGVHLDCVVLWAAGLKQGTGDRPQNLGVARLVEVVEPADYELHAESTPGLCGFVASNIALTAKRGGKIRVARSFGLSYYICHETARNMGERGIWKLMQTGKILLVTQTSLCVFHNVQHRSSPSVQLEPNVSPKMIMIMVVMTLFAPEMLPNRCVHNSGVIMMREGMSTPSLGCSASRVCAPRIRDTVQA